MITAEIGTAPLWRSMSSTLQTGRLFNETRRADRRDRRDLRHPDQALLPREGRHRRLCRAIRPERLLRQRRSQACLLWRAQGEAACARTRRGSLSGSPACAAASRATAPIRPLPKYDAERDLIKINPLADWDIETIRAYVADQARSGQSAACPRLSLDRLRALHPRHQAGRARTRRPLVVGKRREARMRPARRRRPPRSAIPQLRAAPLASSIAR